MFMLFSAHLVTTQLLEISHKSSSRSCLKFDIERIMALFYHKYVLNKR